MNFLIEYLTYWAVRAFGFLIRLMPVGLALAVGRAIGLMGYYFDVRHRAQAYANLKVAFSRSKNPTEIRKISKGVFQNFGQNLIELCRLPLITPQNYEEFVTVEGKENITESLKKNKGLLLLVMHFGSWELASIALTMLGSPYKVIVRPQKRFKKLDELLNSYRSCRGSVVVTRGVGTRDVIRGLNNNEVVAMGADQGGRDGRLVPFFGRPASMSIGAIRLALKMGTPVCFSIIVREKGHKHRLIIQKPLDLQDTGNPEEDVLSNLRQVIPIMERYIEQYPSEYMWFYKIWKYSDQSTTLILSDGKTGHLRQSQAVAQMIARALSERNIRSDVQIAEIVFKNKLAAGLMSLIGLLTHPYFHQGRLGFLKLFLTKESYRAVMSVKADFIVSCGSSVASVNYLLALDHCAKNVAILKPGLLSFRKFSLVVMPQHDGYPARDGVPLVAVTKGAPNLVSEEYLREQLPGFLKKFPGLEFRTKFKIGLLLGGNTKDMLLDENWVRTVVNQIKEIAAHVDADILVTTSRRTPVKIDHLLKKEFSKHPRCQALIIANQDNIPEAVAGILALSAVLVVSGDSISMISEAASSGKSTIVFPISGQRQQKRAGKYDLFIEQLSKQGYVVQADVRNIGQLIQDVAKHKIQTQRLDDNEVVFQAARKVI